MWTKESGNNDGVGCGIASTSAILSAAQTGRVSPVWTNSSSQSSKNSVMYLLDRYGKCSASPTIMRASSRRLRGFHFIGDTYADLAITSSMLADRVPTLDQIYCRQDSATGPD